MDQETTSSQGRLTLRQYLAANAPKVPWETFHVEVEVKPLKKYKEGKHPAQVGVKEAELTEESRAEQDDWLKEKTERRLRLWPWYYADSVIRGGVEYDRLVRGPRVKVVEFIPKILQADPSHER